jgi:hypothetical protein
MALGDMYTDRKITCILKSLLQRSFDVTTKFIDRSGVRFGKLVAVRRSGTNSYKKVMWECVCDCGNTVHVVSGALASGNTSSCGCVLPNFKHGGTGKGSYNTWRAMMRRCYKELDKDYKNYGGRGIAVHAPWHEYLVFASEVGEPTGKQTLDRIDVDGHYEPGNVRWAEPSVQMRNMRFPKTNKTGVLGVLFHNNRYYANITAQGKKFYSKCFEKLEDAAAARKELERIHWGVA